MQRTSEQNKALHKAFILIAEALNDAGLDQRKVLKPEIEIPWTGTAVKEMMWKPIQKAMLNKSSTTELEKIGEIDEVYEVLMRHLMQKCEIEYIPFPFDPEKISNYPDGKTCG